MVSYGFPPGAPPSSRSKAHLLVEHILRLQHAEGHRAGAEAQPQEGAQVPRGFAHPVVVPWERHNGGTKVAEKPWKTWRRRGKMEDRGKCEEDMEEHMRNCGTYEETVEK